MRHFCRSWRLQLGLTMGRRLQLASCSARPRQRASTSFASSPLASNPALRWRPPRVGILRRCDCRYFLMMGHGQSGGKPVAGVYNQQNWAALDSVIQQASAAGVKVILPFADK